MQPKEPEKVSNFSELIERLKKRGKYISKEFQAYGLDLAKELEDWERRSFYIKLAKETSRKTLEKARLFVKDQIPGRIKSKARLFMWKLKELRQIKTSKKKPLPF